MIQRYLSQNQLKKRANRPSNPGRRNVLVIVVLALSVFALFIGSACTKNQSSSSEQSDQLVIGEVSSMTGPEATYGLSAHQGIVLALEDLNATGGVQGKTLKLVSMDSQGKPDESARAITKLISQDRVVSVVTGVISSNALAMAPIAQKNHVPFIATIATQPKVTDLGDFIFRGCLMDSFQGTVMAKFGLDQLKMRRVAILRDVKSDYSIGLAQTFSEVLKQGGGEVVVDQTYTAGDIDFKAQLTAIRGKKPDAMYVPGYYSDVSLIARQARELGMNISLLGGDGWDSPKLKEIGGDALSGSYFSGHYSPDEPSPRLKDFLSHYQEKYHTVPDGLAVMGYEGVQILGAALKKAKTLDREGIREALASSKDVETVTGVVSIDSKRNAARSAVVLMIEKDGKLKYRATVAP